MFRSVKKSHRLTGKHAAVLARLTCAVRSSPAGGQQGALGDAVLQGVEGDDGQPPPWVEQADGSRYGCRQRVQLPVDGYAQRLQRCCSAPVSKQSRVQQPLSSCSSLQPTAAIQLGSAAVCSRHLHDTICTWKRRVAGWLCRLPCALRPCQVTGILSAASSSCVVLIGRSMRASATFLAHRRQPLSSP